MAPFRNDGGLSDDLNQYQDQDQWGMCRAPQKGNHKANRNNISRG